MGRLYGIRSGGRLAEIISRVPFSISVIDVGTDHGYLACALAARGNAVYAVDIAEKPLAKAKANASRFGVADKIHFILADGVPEGLRGKIDCVVIAGVGGETIISILSGAMWLKEESVLIILQPQTKWDLLQKWLAKSGFCVSDEKQVFENGRFFRVLNVRAAE